MSKSNKEENVMSRLTKREYEVVQLICEGLENKEIANKLYISVETAKKHVCNIFKKLEVDNRVQAAVIADRELRV